MRNIPSATIALQPKEAEEVAAAPLFVKRRILEVSEAQDCVREYALRVPVRDFLSLVRFFLR